VANYRVWELSVKIALRWVKTNSYFCEPMLKKLIQLYQQYKEYIRVDLVMYVVLFLLMIIYLIVTVAFR